MEADKNPFEKVSLGTLDILKALGGWSLELFQMHLLSPVSDHFQQENSGGGPMLDRELYDQQQFNV